MFRAAFLVLAILTICRSAPACAQDAVHTVRGVVVDNVTAKPVARVLISTQDRRLATLTDSEGHFTLAVALIGTAPKDMTLNLYAKRPGYLEESVEVALATDATTESTIHLSPAAALSGHISAASVQAARGVNVLLYSRMVEADGTYQWKVERRQNTDSHGDFAFNNLSADDYTVGTSPWMEDDLYPPRTGPAQQYPAVFYGGGTDVESSLKVHLRAGTTARADLSLHLATYYPVHVPLPGKLREGEVRLDVPGTNILSGLSFAYVPDLKEYECWFQPGAYTLNFAVQNGAEQYGQLNIVVADAPLRTASVVMKPTITVPVSLHEQYTHPEPKNEQVPETRFESGRIPRRGEERRAAPPVFLTVESSDGAPKGARSFEANGKINLTPLPPGNYKVTAYTKRGYVAALISGSSDLLRLTLVVDGTATPNPIEVTLRDDSATLDATVDYGSAPLPHQAFVLILPADGRGNAVNLPPDGKGLSTFENLAPGTYRLFAVRADYLNAQRAHAIVPYRDPAFVALIEARAVTITALPNQHLSVTVPMIEVP